MGDMVLKWDHPHDEKGKHTKFQQLWVGPFQIAVNQGPSTYKSQDSIGVGRELTSKWFSSQTLFFMSLVLLFVLLSCT